MGRIFTYKGRRYYSSKADAMRVRRKGDRIYYDPYVKAYYIVRPSKGSFWGF